MARILSKRYKTLRLVMYGMSILTSVVGSNPIVPTKQNQIVTADKKIGEIKKLVNK